MIYGISEYALDQFGPLTLTVFDHWGIRETRDFGEIVFNLVENNLLAKTEKDTREDFAGGFDFGEAFTAPFQPMAKPEKKPARSPKAKRAK